MKDRYYSEAEVIFADNNVKITNEGWSYSIWALQLILVYMSGNLLKRKLKVGKAGLLMSLFW